MQINTVTVIGANGTMGRNVAGVFASFGNAKVNLICRTLDKAAQAVSKASGSVKADAIKANLVAHDYSSIAECLQESDLIFESVAEDLEVKLEINRTIAQFVRNDAIVCTGTSGLSISALSDVFPPDLKRRYFGLHFYTPPYNMTLCEVIPSEFTDRGILEEVKKYAAEKLYRAVVEVKDAPAFLGNRIGFQFINEALQYAEKYQDNGGIDYIDAILGQFTGRSMPPLLTSDFVGLDVHKAIVDNVYKNTNDYAHDTFVMPEFALEMVRENRLGRKSGIGLYKTELSGDGKKAYLVYDIASGEYRKKTQYHFSFSEIMVQQFRNGHYDKAFSVLIQNHSEEARICLEFLLKYVLYALAMADQLGDSLESADHVMACGFNWAPPLAVIDALGGVLQFKKLVTSRLDRSILDKVDLDTILNAVSQSDYDYRKYFKAKL